MQKKIDLYFAGDYLCSTNQSKTCKAAKKRYLELAENRSHSLGGNTRVELRVLKNPQHLRARFDHGKN
jgi:hypothetical protein